MNNLLKKSLIVIGTLIVIASYQNCGEGFQDIELGSEAADIAADIAFDDKILNSEKLSTDVKILPKIKWIRRVDKTEYFKIRAYKGQSKNGSKFKKFNFSVNNKYYSTTTCGGSSGYCQFKFSFKNFKPGQTYDFKVSAIDSAGDWTPNSNTMSFLVPGEASSPVVAATVAAGTVVNQDSSSTAPSSSPSSSAASVDFTRSGHYKSQNSISGRYRTYIVVSGKMCENSSGEIRDKYNTKLITQAEKTAMFQHFADKYFKGAPCK